MRVKRKKRQTQTAKDNRRSENGIADISKTEKLGESAKVHFTNIEHFSLSVQ